MKNIFHINMLGGDHKWTFNYICGSEKASCSENLKKTVDSGKSGIKIEIAGSRFGSTSNLYFLFVERNSELMFHI